MRIWHGTAGLLGVLLLAACGTPEAGDDCNTIGYLCANRTTALECRAGTWRQLPCRGVGGCELVGGHIECDVSLNQPGDACGAQVEGGSICTPAGDATLECRGGVFIQTLTCTSCTVVGGQLACQQ
jgi:hypothetical protein